MSRFLAVLGFRPLELGVFYTSRLRCYFLADIHRGVSFLFLVSIDVRYPSVCRRPKDVGSSLGLANSTRVISCEKFSPSLMMLYMTSDLCSDILNSGIIGADWGLTARPWRPLQSSRLVVVKGSLYIQV